MKILSLLTNYFYFQEAEKEASENISNICARMRHKDFEKRFNNEKIN